MYARLKRIRFKEFLRKECDFHLKRRIQFNWVPVSLHMRIQISFFLHLNNTYLIAKYMCWRRRKRGNMAQKQMTK